MVIQVEVAEEDIATILVIVLKIMGAQEDEERYESGHGSC